MAVLTTESKFWPHPVPYKPCDDKTVKDAIALINKAVGFDVFVPHEQQTNVVTFAIGSTRSCSAIGCQTGPQEISLKQGSDTFSCVHEMMHCLGFEHEQFHKEYAWDAADTGQAKPRSIAPPTPTTAAPSRARSSSLTGATKGPAVTTDASKKPEGGGASGKQVALPDTLSEQEAETAGSKGTKVFKPRNQAIYAFLIHCDNSVYADSYLAQRMKKSGQLTPITGCCDYNSVMMYDYFSRAAKYAAKAGHLDGITIVGTSKLPDGILSAGDVDAVKQVYGKRWGAIS